MPRRTQRSKPSRRVGVKGSGPIPRAKPQVRKLHTPDESVHTSSGAGKKKNPLKRLAERGSTGRKNPATRRRKVLGRKRIRPAGVRRR